jgi:group I intron endonuclease
MIDNRENNIWTVYIHIVPKSISDYNYDKYYVGITRKTIDFRWKKDGYGYVSQEYFYNAIKKYGWNNIEHYIIAEHLTEYEAKEFEKILIKTLKCNVNKDKYGYNCTDGGDGTSGKSMSEEEKEKRRIKYSGKGNPYYGKKHSDEIRQKMSKNHVDVNGGNNPRAKQFYQFDLDGNYIATYDSVRTAARFIDATDGIGKSAREHKPACGFLWGYDKDVIIKNNIPCLKYKYKKEINKTYKHIYMFDLNKNFMKDYISGGEAGRDNNIQRNMITNAARKRGICKGYYWCYENYIGFDKNNKPILLDK